MSLLIKLKSPYASIALITFFLFLFTSCSNISEQNQNLPLSLGQLLLSDLQKNKIGLIAPSFRLEKSDAIKLIEILPWMESVLNTYTVRVNNKYAPYANSIERRKFFLWVALHLSKSKVIWSLRGGAGSKDLIPSLIETGQPIQKKVIVGYSDTTALHLYVSQKWGWKSIHGPMLVEFLKVRDPNNLIFLWEMLNVRKKFYYAGIKPITPLKSSSITGKLTGGHLSLLTRSLRQNWQLETHNKIILIEHNPSDQSTLFEIKRLISSGLLDQAKAIVLGNLENNPKEYALVIKEITKGTKVPVFTTDFFGHGYKNYPWIYNAEAELKKLSDDNWELSFSNEGIPLLR
jgi:muramoyltetrapeptide carboxypeptidase